MLSALLPLICGLLLTPQQAQAEPFIQIGIWYAGGQARPPDAGLTDLETGEADSEGDLRPMADLVHQNVTY